MSARRQATSPRFAPPPCSLNLPEPFLSGLSHPGIGKVNTLVQQLTEHMNTLIINLTAQQLRQAANLKEKIATHQKELDRLFGVPAKAQRGAAAKGKRTMSAAARAKISAAAKARWAKIKGTSAAAKGKRTMSAAARAKISAAAKARWAKIKGTKSPVEPVKPKGTMSAATRAKLSAKMKAVWTARKAAQKK